MNKKISCLFICLLLSSLTFVRAQQPDDFVMLDSLEGVQVEHAYFGKDNFLGKPVEGYHAPKLLATLPTYRALQKVQAHLEQKGLGLKIFDAYRPQPAVNHFVRWAKDLDDTIMKQKHYPDVAKEDLFEEGYIAAKSGHSRGSTVDLTVVDLQSGEPLDMGTPFDFFGKESWPFSKAVSDRQRENRMILRQAMLKFGFEPLPTEWWHFTLKEEPYPETYFNFIIR